MRIFGRRGRDEGAAGDDASAEPVAPTPPPVRQVGVREGTIRLGQLLKLAGMVEDGVEARRVVTEGLVLVDGEVETRRGKQLAPGSTVRLGEDEVRLVLDDGTGVDDGLPW